MISVKRKDAKEANENLLRRFNRRVLQSGVVAKAKTAQRFSKPQSKRDRRNSAIVRDQRKAAKNLQIRLGLVKAK
ncbi:30S ribosomal protein S21 [Candidatus Saccharibacteria bacterium]|nr:30S ribosomal protein S21 [Candidatus Saccharibacteria bacterium]